MPGWGEVPDLRAGVAEAGAMTPLTHFSLFSGIGGLQERMAEAQRAGDRRAISEIGASIVIFEGLYFD